MSEERTTGDELASQLVGMMFTNSHDLDIGYVSKYLGNGWFLLGIGNLTDWQLTGVLTVEAFEIRSIAKLGTDDFGFYEATKVDQTCHEFLEFIELKAQADMMREECNECCDECDECEDDD